MYFENNYGFSEIYFLFQHFKLENILQTDPGVTFGKIVHALFLINAKLSTSEFFKRSQMPQYVSHTEM